MGKTERFDRDRARLIALGLQQCTLGWWAQYTDGEDWRPLDAQGTHWGNRTAKLGAKWNLGIETWRLCDCFHVDAAQDTICSTLHTDKWDSVVQLLSFNVQTENIYIFYYKHSQAISCMLKSCPQCVRSHFHFLPPPSELMPAIFQNKMIFMSAQWVHTHSRIHPWWKHITVVFVFFFFFFPYTGWAQIAYFTQATEGDTDPLLQSHISACKTHEDVLYTERNATPDTEQGVIY